MGNITPQEGKRIAKEAYIFGFPIVANYRVFINRLISKDPLMQGAGFNQFAHNRQLFPPQTPDTTQRDTIFSLGIIDLRREAVVISVPDVPEGQAYMLQMGDTSTECLPYVSTITTGNKAGDYVLVGPDFQGYLPAQKYDGVMTTRGQFVIMLGRTVVFDPNDLSPAHAVQDGMQMRPLSEFLGTELPPEPEPVDFLPWDDEAAAGLGIFDYINMAMAWHPPAIHEVEAKASFVQIGVIPGQRFSTAGLSAEVVGAMEEGVAKARAIIAQMAQEVVSVAINGIPLRVAENPPDRQELWKLKVWGPLATGLEVGLEVRSPQAIKMIVVDRAPGLPDIPGQSIAPQPDYLLPYVSPDLPSHATLVSSSYTFD